MVYQPSYPLDLIARKMVRSRCDRAQVRRGRYLTRECARSLPHFPKRLSADFPLHVRVEGVEQRLEVGMIDPAHIGAADAMVFKK